MRKRIARIFAAREPQNKYTFRMRTMPPNDLPRSMETLVRRYDHMITEAELHAREMGVFSKPFRRSKGLSEVRKAIKKRNQLVSALSSLDFYGSALKRNNPRADRKALEEGFEENRALTLKLLGELKPLMKQGVFEASKNRALKQRIKKRLEDSRSGKRPKLPQ